MKHKIHHFYQSDQYSCVQAAAAMLLSYFEVSKTPQDILKEVPVRYWPGKDEPAGTPNQDIAAYFCGLGFDTQIISADTWVTDLAWTNKPTDFIKKRLQEASGHLTAPAIGREGTELYIQAYLDFIKAGGKLSVVPVIASGLLKGLVKSGPFIVTVAYDTLHATGKSVNKGNTQATSQDDDIKGTSPNHSIVISGYRDGVFEYYDPWARPGIHKVESDQLVAAIATAQQECDNMIIVVAPKKTH